MKTKRGYTLIELLVVIGTVAVLAALLLGGVARAHGVTIVRSPALTSWAKAADALRDSASVAARARNRIIVLCPGLGLRAGRSLRFKASR